jgi:hypothetical protein
VDPHWGQLQVRKVYFRDDIEDPAILGPTGGVAPQSREKLAPQAQQVFWSPNQVVRGLPRSPGLWIRSPGPLAGRRGFGRLGPLDRDLRDPGRWGPMGTHVSQGGEAVHV